jgi:hypothetical protein
MKRSLVLLLAICVGALAAGCDSSSTSPTDSGVLGADGGGGVDAGCYRSPSTHFEIINACTSTSVQALTKSPVLPLLHADGTLPPLP